jgi:hypothetical protein
MSLLRHKYKIELFSASMLPPAKRQRVRDGMNYYFSWVRIKKQHVLCGNRCFCNFVYYIYCTTLLMYGLVKKNKKLFCMIKLYTYIYFLYRHDIDAENNSILYLCLSKDITPEKEGTTFLNLQE